MRVKYCCDAADKRAFDQYYAQQSGGGLPVFYGARMQRGHGIGNIFASIARFAMPIIRRIAPALGRKALQTGAQIAGDIAAGQSFKDATKTRIADVINEGINKFVPAEDGQSGSGIRRGRKRPRKKQKKKKLTKRRKKSTNPYGL